MPRLYEDTCKAVGPCREATPREMLQAQAKELTQRAADLLALADALPHELGERETQVLREILMHVRTR